MLAGLISVLAILGVASASPLAERQSGVQVVRSCRNSGQVALTFDGESPHLVTSPEKCAGAGAGADCTDGPFNYEYDVANALNGGKGTFFLNVCPLIFL